MVFINVRIVPEIVQEHFLTFFHNNHISNSNIQILPLTSLQVFVLVSIQMWSSELDNI